MTRPPPFSSLRPRAVATRCPPSTAVTLERLRSVPEPLQPSRSPSSTRKLARSRPCLARNKRAHRFERAAPLTRWSDTTSPNINHPTARAGSRTQNLPVISTYPYILPLLRRFSPGLIIGNLFQLMTTLPNPVTLFTCLLFLLSFLSITSIPPYSQYMLRKCPTVSSLKLPLQKPWLVWRAAPYRSYLWVAQDPDGFCHIPTGFI